MFVFAIDDRGPRPRAGASRWRALGNAVRALVAVGLLALPMQGFNAVSSTLSPLNNLPRYALVIGNSRYGGTPLKNPGNDANAIAEQLRRMGFTVTLKLDATRQDMIDTMQSFGGSLAKQKAVGLFYFAGHGAQLAWRNYLIPVDAQIEEIGEMRSKAVDLGTLLDGLTKAGNPMNVVILDACRDNPFGKGRVEQQGLSQIDAPPGTLLAYATSPGNVAADGAGANGLYTEYLLREMQAREAKIEDVFKRVRLNVRRQSGGQQIPWESTSLEEDFYFQPPREVKKLSAEEAEKQFEEELGIWERIKAAKDPAPLEDYMRRFPSGKFSELAQFRLDRLFAELQTRRVAVEQQKQTRLAEERRAALEKQFAEDKRLAEEKRLAVEKRLAEERRLAQEKRLADDKRLAKLTEDKRNVEENRLAQERKLAEERRIAEEKKLAEESRLADEKRVAEEKRFAQAKLAAQREDEKRAKARVAAAAPDSRDAEAPQSAKPAVKVASTAVNPYSRGTVRADSEYRIGDRYTYRVIDTLTRMEGRQFTTRVTGLTDSEVIFNNGNIIRDPLGNIIKPPNGTQFSGQQFFVTEYSIGKKWTTRYRYARQDGVKGDVEVDFKVVAKEAVTVPAGTFDAYKVEGQGFNYTTGAYLRYVYWIAPDQVRRPIVFEAVERRQGGRYFTTDREELVAYRQVP